MSRAPMPMRIYNALLRRWAADRGMAAYELPLHDRPSELELLGWAQSHTDQWLGYLRNLGATSIGWIRSQPPAPAPGPNVAPPSPDAVLSAWLDGYEEGLQAGRALGAAAVVGPAFLEGVKWTGRANGSKSGRVQ